MSSISFDYLLEKMRPLYLESEFYLKNEIYQVYDNEGHDFLYLETVSSEGFNIFVLVILRLFSLNSTERFFETRKATLIDLILLLKTDARCDNSLGLRLGALYAGA
ncbi:hypothetical protein ACO0LI_15965 [Undibacterium sp. Tian12W]